MFKVNIGGINIWIVAVACILFVVLRFPSIIEPSWYGDEGIYQVMGRAINEGRVLYQEIWDNKPPLLYLIYAAFNGNLFSVKLLSLLSGFLSVVAFFILVRKFFKNKLAVYFSIFLYVFLFGSPILEGNIANAENFMLLPIITSAIFVLEYSKNRKLKHLVIAGLLLSISLLLKIVAFFDFAAFLIFLLIMDAKKNRELLVNHYATYGFVFILLFFAFSVYFLANGAFYDFFQAVFIQNLSYVGEENSLLIPMGALVFKTLFLGAFIYLLKKKSSKLSEQTIFIYLWTAFALFNAFFSERAYTHYLLVLLPAFCLLAGNLFEEKKWRLFELALISGIVIVSLFHFQVYRKNIEYYINFFDFITNQKSITEYESFFDNNTPRDYMIAEFILANIREEDKVFLWSDSAQIYALSGKLPIGKYIVAYHIKFYENADISTKQQIEMTKPKYIVQTAEGQLDSDLLSSYSLRYIISGAKIYEREI
jgi:hypothetical protein